MSGADREIELKFSCGPEDLAAVLAAAPAGDDETRELISVYFDTPDLALQKAGASLRVREHKGRRIQTLKRGQGLVREEHEAPIEGLAPDPALAPLPSLLPRGATLKPAFNVRVSRRQRTFRYLDAEIELALDQGEVTGGDRQTPICEVELELKSGPPGALFALARELSGAAPLYLAFDSKAARGQALVAGEAPASRRSGRIALAEDAKVGEAFQAVARQALAQIAANAAALRAQPGAEPVHQLRVGVRRLRSALTTFKPLLEGEGLETLKADLKWLGHACDTARNLDVFAEETLKPAEFAAVSPAAGLHALRKTVEAARRRAWSEAGEAAAGARFRALMIDAAAWVETGDWQAGHGAGEAIKPFARKALKRHLKTLGKRGRAARDGDDTARHHLRIEAKKLRYAAEALAGLYGEKRAHRYLRHLKDLQAVLGALNDLVTVEPLIAGLELSPEAAFAGGELVGLKMAAKPKLLAAAKTALDRLEAAEPFWG
jgi:inorganic triphosphatase YgiF